VDLLGISALELTRLIKRKVVSLKEVVKLAADAISSKNPLINAVVSLRVEEALSEAEELEARMAKEGHSGLLLGVPILVKDLEDVKGMKTTYGSLAFRENMAFQDSLQVQRLKAQGAIVLGKTNTPEFGFTGFTKNRLFGVTKNPWDLSKTPGGSSGGSAAAVTAQMVPVATGSDAGGSIRIPASYCGCVGLKPTFGRIPLGPQFQGFGACIWTLGPLTRCVEDAWLYLRAAQGYHPLDPHSGIMDGGSLSTLQPPSGNLKICYSLDLGRYPVDPEVRELFEKAIIELSSLGHQLIPLKEEIPDLESTWWTYMAMDLAFQLKDVSQEKRAELSRSMVKTVEEVMGLSLAQLNKEREIRSRAFTAVQRIFKDFDALITPTTPTVAFQAEGPPPNTIDGRLVRLLDVVAFTYPFNLTGHPAISIRAGLTSQGLPAGLQIIGPMCGEGTVLSLAYQFQEATGCHKTWPSLQPKG